MATKLDATDAPTEQCCPAVLPVPLTEERAVELAGTYALLADPVRLRLLSLLAAAPAGEVCVCELVEPLGRSQPTISHHLRMLADAGVVSGDKRGRWVWYRIAPDRLTELRDVLA